MITKATIRVIDDDLRGHHILKTLNRSHLGNIAAQIERVAHVEAARWLQQHYPDQWCYRYGKLRSGDDMPANKDKLDSVIRMDWIADGGFTGQFQWREGGAGGLVPVVVDITDPEREAEYERKHAEYRAEEARKAAAVKAKVDALPQMRFREGGAELWQSWLDANQDGYGGAVMIYAEQFARLLQAEVNPELATLDRAELEQSNPEFLRGVDIAFGDAAERASHEADTVGLSGFQYGAAVSMLAQAWIFGEDLRRWHNRQYGHDGGGVVNPALLTLKD